MYTQREIESKLPQQSYNMYNIIILYHTMIMKTVTTANAIA